MLNIIAPFMTDSYKLSHHGFMDKSITKIYSNLTARSFKHFFKKDVEETVFFGLQSFIKLHLIDHWNKTFFSRPKEEVISEMKRTFDAYLGEGAVPLAHFEALHDLGYLPIEIRALPEGARVPVKVPYLTIYNTHDDFAWVTNYLETIMSTEVWKMITTATSVYENRKLVNEYALKTTGSLVGTEFQVHDFCLRGMSGIEDGMKQGAAFLLSSNGTDNIPALPFIEQIYNGDITKEFIGTSIPASEHSIACSTTALMGNNEYEAFIKWITVDYPTGLVSVVADTWDYWEFLGYVIDAKEIIKSREPNALGLSKAVVRPDCYDEKTSVYTNTGWKLFSELNDDDLVAQVKDDGSYEFVKPLKYVKQEYEGEMFHFLDQKGKVDLLVTPNHRMIVEVNGKEKVVFAEKMTKNGHHYQKMTRTASAENNDFKISDLERLMIAFQADGSFCSGSKSKIQFSFSKKRKIERLMNIIGSLGLECVTYDLKDGISLIQIKVEDINLFKKDFSWVEIKGKKYCQEFVEELSYWDSCRRSDTRFKFDTTVESVIEVVEKIAIGAGYGVLISEYKDNRKEHFSKVYTANIMIDNKIGGQSWVKNNVDYKGFVYCVQVPTGKLLVKRNRSTMVCGNSGDPVETICGHNIKDVTKEYVSYDQFVSCIASEMVDEVAEETPHGEMGDHEPVRSYKYKGKYYRVTVSIDWNRHDKQYYYVDGYYLKSIEEYNPSIEELGTIEYLWENLGEHEVNDKGYKVLPSYIGVIYGDGINYDVAKEILKRLEAKGFASTSVVFGFGSYSAQFVTRDTLGMAVKATALQLNTGAWVELFKDPITDDGMKKSAKGLLKVEKVDGKLVLKDQVSWEESQNSELRPVFRDGKLLVDDSFAEIRNRLWS